MQPEWIGPVGAVAQSVGSMLSRFGLVGSRVNLGSHADTMQLIVAGGVEDRVLPLVRVLHRPPLGVRTHESCGGHPGALGARWQRPHVAFTLCGTGIGDVLAVLQMALDDHAHHQEHRFRWRLVMRDAVWQFERRRLRRRGDAAGYAPITGRAARDGIALRLECPVPAWTAPDALALDIARLTDTLDRALEGLEIEYREAAPALDTRAEPTRAEKATP